MAFNLLDMQEPIIDTNTLSCEIFSILEAKFLFGYDDQKLWIPKQKSSEHDEQESQEPQDGQTVVDANTETDTTCVPMKNHQKGKICILSIDGGCGMRGIIPGKALAYLENALKVKSGDSDARIVDYFDVVAGSGVGGIFATMLSATRDQTRPIFKADDTWRFLVDRGNKIFNQSGSNSRDKGLVSRLFRSRSGGSGGGSLAAMEAAMKEAFGDKNKSLTLKDTLKPVLVPCFDMSSKAPFLFSRADALETDSFDFRLWEVCCATAAEPGMFEPVSMRSVDGKTRCVAVDGGLAMNNPTSAAITHVLHNKQEFPCVRGVDDILVLSLGSGQLLEVSCDYEKVRKWKTKEWVQPVARISGDGSADMVDQAVAMAFGQCRSSNYVRIQSHGTSLGRCGPNVDKDPSPININSEMLVAIAEEMLKQKNVESVLFGGKRIAEQTNFEKLDWFADQLVKEHRMRKERAVPTVALKQAAPKPPT